MLLDAVVAYFGLIFILLIAIGGYVGLYVNLACECLPMPDRTIAIGDIHGWEEQMDSIKPGEKLRLGLTAAERGVLLETLTALPAGTRVAIQAASASESIMFTFDELQDLARCVAFAADRAKVKTVQRTLDVASGKIQHQILSYMNSRPVRLSKSQKSKKRKPTGGSKTSSKSVKPGLLYQFKIMLIRIESPIWRRIQVKDCTLDKLHEHIQTAMGWTNSHLNLFDVGGERYGDPELLEDDFNCSDSTRTKLSKILLADGKPFTFRYDYDFGDSWSHDVLFEGCPPLDLNCEIPAVPRRRKSLPARRLRRDERLCRLSGSNRRQRA